MKVDWKRIRVGNRFVRVDVYDFGTVKQRKWYITQSHTGKNLYYARGYDPLLKKITTMHSFIMGSRDGLEIDHVNGNGLDNRKFNLRFCTRSQNRANSRPPTVRVKTRYQGIRWNVCTKGWQAKIVKDGKSYSCGVYPTQEEAAFHYDLKAIELFSEFARTNFPWIQRYYEAKDTKLGWDGFNKGLEQAIFYAELTHQDEFVKLLKDQLKVRIEREAQLERSEE